MKKFFSILCFFICFLQLKSQENCLEALRVARELHENGQHDSVIKLLQTKLSQCPYNKQELEQVYKILAASYFEIDEIEEGNKLIYKILRSNPNFRANYGIDPAAFTHQIDRFEVLSTLDVGAKMGISSLLVEVKKARSLLDTADMSEPYITDDPPMVSFFARYYFSKRFTLNMEVNYQTNSFEKWFSTRNETVEIDYIETLRQVKIPVSLAFSPFHFRSVYFWLFGGGSFTVYSQSEYELSTTFTVNNPGGKPIGGGPTESGTLPNNYRNGYYSSLFAGIMIEFRRNNFCFFADLRYNYALQDYSKPENRYLDPKIILERQFVSDDIRLHSFELSLGITYTLFHRIKQKY